jgi:hypothetical protein
MTEVGVCPKTEARKLYNLFGKEPALVAYRWTCKSSKIIKTTDNVMY